jgi:hypothetical protein
MRSGTARVARNSVYTTKDTRILSLLFWTRVGREATAAAAHMPIVALRLPLGSRHGNRRKLPIRNSESFTVGVY